MSVIWLTGAEGIGKTRFGARTAGELGLIFVQFDDFRAQGWSKLRTGRRLANTDFARCSTYQDARTLAVKGVACYLDLHARLGPPMFAALWRSLPKSHEAPILVECAAKYLTALPVRGLRVRGFVESQRHVRNLRGKCGVTARDAALMAAFFQDVEKEALAQHPVDAHVRLDELTKMLRGFLV